MSFLSDLVKFFEKTLFGKFSVWLKFTSLGFQRGTKLLMKKLLTILTTALTNVTLVRWKIREISSLGELSFQVDHFFVSFILYQNKESKSLSLQ